MMVMTRKLVLLCLLVVASSLKAQQITVKSLRLLPADNTAIESPVYDNLKDPCALVKIDAGGLKGLFFPKKGSDHNEDFYDENTGLYLVYIPTGTRRLTYNHADYLSGDIVFADFNTKLEIGKTYLLTMEADISQKSGGMVIMTVSPQNARVVFDGKEAPLSEGGVYSFNVKPGVYDYVVRADNRITQRGTISAKTGKEAKVSAELQWIRHTVDVRCNVGNAQVYVDDIYYGKPGKMSLPQGRHTIGVKAKDHIDMTQTVDINSGTLPLNFTLKKNENKVVIGSVAVTIYSLSNSSRIYKNQRQIKEWKKSGDVVNFMPGKYLLSDDDYNEYKLVVKKGSAPMTVRF